MEIIKPFNPTIILADIVLIHSLSTASPIFYTIFLSYLKKSRAMIRFRTSQTSVASFCVKKPSARFCAKSFFSLCV